MKRGKILWGATFSWLLLVLFTPSNTNAQTRDVLPRRVRSQSCANYGSLPMTAASIRSRGNLLGLSGDASDAAFETFSFVSLGIAEFQIKEEFFSSSRALFTTLDVLRGKPRVVVESNVIPDEFGALEQIIDGKIIPYEKSVFYEAKNVGGEEVAQLRPGYANHQIRGFLDALQVSPAGLSLLNPTPRLYLLTASSATIPRATRNLATRWGVAIYQSMACDNLPNNGRLGIDDMIMGDAILVNPRVYARTNVTPLPSIFQRVASTLNPLGLPPDDSPDDPPPPSDPPVGLCSYSTEPDVLWPCDSEPSAARLSARNSLAQEFSSRPSEVTAVPEPTSTVAVLAVGTWVGVSWRKRKSEKQLAEGNIT